MAQDYNKDLYIVLAGTGVTTIKNFVDNVEDYIFGDRDEREATILMPYTQDLSGSLGRVLNEWAIGDDDEPNYPVHAYVEPEAGHKSVAKAKKSLTIDEVYGITMSSAALEAAMSHLVQYQKEGNEVVVVVVYDEDSDVRLVGELKNYNSIPVLNLNGMIDDFPGFKTTDEILKEEREREEFETKEAIRIAAEKEQEKAAKAAAAPAKKAAAPRKRAASKPAEEKPLTESSAPRKAAAPRKKAAAPKPAPVVEEKASEPEYKVGDVVEVGGIPFVKHSELPSELEPVKPMGQNPDQHPWSAVGNPHVSPDVWTDVAQAKAAVDKGEVTHYAVSKESLAALSEGITDMATSFSKVMSAMTKIIEGE